MMIKKRERSSSNDRDETVIAEKRVRNAAWERDEAEKEAALEAALLKATSHGDCDDIASLVLKVGWRATNGCDHAAAAAAAHDMLQSIFEPQYDQDWTPVDRGLEATMVAHTARVEHQQRLREEEEERVMAEDMRKIAELEREAEAIERATKAVEAARIAQLEREAFELEEAAIAAEATKRAELQRAREDAFSVSFAVGPRWAIHKVARQ